ncbi:DUF6431 domain-containing protein [Anoxynatronum buryatiense]|uniref:DUF6431 domain-containing protein n=1 Tax=Anoxynatronum buryatiense TaxID=489973 RepID=A0AA46AHE9_9CLOT|nr:DUF6431 domain-containing protein [Anoxynatronum buryatiense]SMP38734.1 hypothetical protein SAMN06296020_101142 [Anoxynatronum buryatiense]
MKTPKPVFFVRSLEPFFCPCCHSSEKKVIGSRNRKVLEAHEANGDLVEKVLRIRRLQCKSCLKIHHQLPDLLIPYKHHAAALMESTLEEQEVPVEESTLRRWKVWFDGITCHLLGALHTMERKETMEKTPLMGTALQRFRKYVGSAPGWLGRIVQSLVKKNLWVQTRSAFCAR